MEDALAEIAIAFHGGLRDRIRSCDAFGEDAPGDLLRDDDAGFRWR